MNNWLPQLVVTVTTCPSAEIYYAHHPGMFVIAKTFILLLVLSTSCSFPTTSNPSCYPPSSTRSYPASSHKRLYPSITTTSWNELALFHPLKGAVHPRSCYHMTTTTTAATTSSTAGSKKTTDPESNIAEGGGMDPPAKTGTLRIYGPDRKGIVAAFSQLLYGHGCGIVDSEQHTDREANMFFQRIHFDYATMHTDRVTIEAGIKEVCERFQMQSILNWNERKKKIAIMVSKYDHCLWELLLRHQAGELDCEIAMIVSNHPDLDKVAQTFQVPYHVFKITKDTKHTIETDELQLLRENQIDLVILARYMQIVSDEFCRTFPVINIHHSFLPAFVGGRPYHRAHERGVKLIGATAHYATADLDEGPIIEQDITRISHRDAVNDLLRKGRTLEKNVLVTAVRAHLEDRIIVYHNKCVVFDG